MVESISLVIPTYNRANLIGDTIECALAQTQPFSEIIVVDDGSTDDTKELLNGYGSRLRTIHTSNCGVQAARNTGVSASESGIIALCDSDDLLEPEFAEKTATWFSHQQEIDIMYSNFINFDENTVSKDKFSAAPTEYFSGGQTVGSFIHRIPHLYEKSLKFQPLFSSGVAFKKDFFNRIGGFNTEFNRVGAEDWEFTLRAIAEGNVSVCTEVLCRVRRHAGNDSQNSKHMNLGEALILEYGMKNHRGTSHLRDKILAEVDIRRKRAFDAAYACGNLSEAKHILTLHRHKPTDTKSLLKRLILNMPNGLRNALYRLSQGVPPFNKAEKDNS